MHDAKTQLSRLVDRAAAGEEIVIARNGEPVARLVALEEKPATRQLGVWRGKIWLADDWDSDEVNEEIARDFYVSVNTVKAHLKALYRKLSVGSRREAVRRGRELRLIG